MDRPLLMIPGPIEVSPRVQAAVDGPPDSHVSAGLIAAFGDALRGMRTVWSSGLDALPFVLAGSGTLAMEAAVCNLLDPGQQALVVHTGVFSGRMAEMLRRRGVSVEVVAAPAGETPSLDAIRAGAAVALPDAVFATHVDTSTGVRIDLAPISRLAREFGALFVVDGVCATAGEACDMAGLDIDVLLTASQKAVGLPPGLALFVASARARDARARLAFAPPLALDFEVWTPIMEAYEAGRPSYFATPATPLIRGLAVAMAELADIDAVTARHADVAGRMRAAWAALGLRLVPSEAEAANTLSALWIPEGFDATLPAAIAARGVLVAGGLHPDLRTRTIRVGHMGFSTTQPAHLARTVEAIAAALGRDARPALDALG